jgi:small subunit ribosomal protein S24e
MLDPKDIQILEKFENPYLNRDEYMIQLNLENKPFPKRQEVIEALAKFLNENAEKIIIRKLISRYGGTKAYSIALVYKDLDSKKIELEHVILRHKNKEERKKILEEKKKKKLELKQSKEKK